MKHYWLATLLFFVLHSQQALSTTTKKSCSNRITGEFISRVWNDTGWRNGFHPDTNYSLEILNKISADRRLESVARTWIEMTHSVGDTRILDITFKFLIYTAGLRNHQELVLDNGDLGKSTLAEYLHLTLHALSKGNNVEEDLRLMSEFLYKFSDNGQFLIQYYLKAYNFFVVNFFQNFMNVDFLRPSLNIKIVLYTAALHKKSPTQSWAF